MGNKKLGIGIIGCGAISGSHINGYLKFEDQCEIKAVSDISAEKALQAATAAGNADIYVNYEDMLKRDDIDVVSVCTPPYLHKEHVVASLKAGKHVLCEKPLAPSLQDCDEMIAEAKLRNLKLAVVFQYRYRQDFKQMKHVIDSGMLGPIVFAQMNALYWRGDRYYNIPWRGKFETECGGVTMNHAIHPMDIFLSIMGDIESVRAETYTEAHNIEVEDASFSSIRFKNGAVAQINCTLNSVHSDITMTFSGKYRSVTISRAHVPQQPVFGAVCNDPGGFPSPDEQGRIELENVASQIRSGTDDHTGPIQDLFDAIRYDREPIVNGWEGRRTIEAITAIYKSATLGEKVTLPIQPDDPWYTRDGILRLVKRNIVKETEVGNS